MTAPRPFLSLIIKTDERQAHQALPFLLLAVFLLNASGARAQQAPKVLRLGKIEVVGLERYTQEQVVAVSGLQVGQPIDIPAADEAATRLLNSGFFKTLSYRFRSAGSQVTVTFQVVEAKESAPVIFDNFVWFSEQELQDAIRRQIPSFDGTAPETGDMPEKIKKALQTLLDDRKIPGQVDYMYSADLAGKNAKHFFSVKGIKIPICKLLFPGALDVKESELIKTSKPLFDMDFSAGDIKSFARVNLLPIYRQRGHLRASFLDPVVQPAAADENCKNGVSVTVQVDEGSIYTWDKAEWSGNEVLSAQELTMALGMKSGERADGLKIDKGPVSVMAAYGKKGYIEARLRGVPEYDDANRRVSYHYSVTEGGQYRMGNLEIKGLPEDLTKRLKESWKLQPSDAFDTSYYETFMKKAGMEIGAAGLHVSEGSVQYKRNEVNRTVDVIIEIK